MRFDILAEPLEQLVVQQLGERLVSLSRDDGPGPASDFSLRESLMTWILDLPPEGLDNRPLESFRRRIEFWHHQIWQAQEPRYFARSIVRHTAEPDDPSMRLCKVAKSPLAARIDSTLAWIDGHVSLIGEPPGHDWLVRLLIAARVEFFGLALVESEEIQKAVTLSGSLGEAPRVVEAGQLREEILSRRVVFGLG